MRNLTVLIAAVVATTGCGFGVAAAAKGDPPAPRGDTVVEVTGDAENGFGIRHLDGTELFPPTRSEARAECGEYDRRVDRVRCRAEVRTWYDDLAVLQQALAWAHAS
ncbi:hypothetical protein [Nocardioides sp. YIM 152315]|uniref:hypothetical protein n=1 Tax=Nocardioides sp. YIM 152315 TaxID=3031760 RepID=UPI0023DBF6CE|nr:hypothetical protein [Nocardioides sp. YIM 152315]MDF1604042.1 hypothetical protein [Nocardioides sp. YIM 152315]